MKTMSTTDARKNIKTLIELVKETGTVFAIGRRDKPEALLIKFPRDYNKVKREGYLTSISDGGIKKVGLANTFPGNRIAARLLGRAILVP